MSLMSLLSSFCEFKIANNFHKPSSLIVPYKKFLCFAIKSCIRPHLYTVNTTFGFFDPFFAPPGTIHTLTIHLLTKCQLDYTFFSLLQSKMAKATSGVNTVTSIDLSGHISDWIKVQ